MAAPELTWGVGNVPAREHAMFTVPGAQYRPQRSIFTTRFFDEHYLHQSYNIVFRNPTFYNTLLVRSNIKYFCILFTLFLASMNPRLRTYIVVMINLQYYPENSTSSTQVYGNLVRE